MESNKKYEIMAFEGRIKALKSFGDVKEGEVGGFIDTESNLSHEGDCWVYDNAQVSDGARLTDNATARDNCRIDGQAWIWGNAKISGDAVVDDYAQISGYAKIYESAKVIGDAKITDHAMVYEFAQVKGDAHIGESAWIYGNAMVSGYAKVTGKAFVFGNAVVKKKMHVGDEESLGTKQVPTEASVLGFLKGLHEDVSEIKLKNGRVYRKETVTTEEWHMIPTDK